MELSQLASVQMKVSPRLVAMNHVLELSSMELQQLINQELSENPALEVQERETCPRCGAGMDKMVCQHCMSTSKQQEQDQPVGDQSMTRDDYFYEDGPSMARKDPDDDFDPMVRVASEMSIQEHLMREMGASLSPDQLPIAEFLIGNLDDRGFLDTTVTAVSQILDRTIEDVEAVLKELQQQEPIGIGARDLRECLLLQIDYLAEQGITHPHVRAIVEHHLSQLGEHKFSRIAQEMRISSQSVSDAAAFIKKYLNPFPAQGRPTEGGVAAGYVLPDVIISRRANGFEVDVVESKRIFLRINPLYRDLMMRAEQDASRLNEDEKRHIQQYVSRARLFMANIDQRRQTLQRIAAFLVSFQSAYLQEGVRHLRPLTRAMVAIELGVHESTVSRATAAKYIMIPSGEVVPLSTFFTPSLSAKDVIKDIIEHEQMPLTDERIADKLGKMGIIVARRTVAKYREQLGILPSILRS